MKGLLIKDFKLMKQQKNYFVFLIMITGLQAEMKTDIFFILTFLTFTLSLFALSTISYDEFDNGNAFLFTLPVSRTMYAIEKYCFSFMLAVSSWIFALILSTIVNLYKGMGNITDIMKPAVMILMMIFMMQAVMIPTHIKFGAEKVRIVMFSMVGLILVGGTVIQKVTKSIGIDWSNQFPSLTEGEILAITAVVTIIVLLISVKISIAIMNKKEF